MSPGFNPVDDDTFYFLEEEEDHIHSEEQKCGDYFFYRTALDTISNIRYSGTQIVSFSQTTGEKFVYVTVN